MNLFWKALAKVRLVKYRARWLWEEVPDTFQLLDRFYILAGIDFDAPNDWQRFGWKLYLLVGNFQMLISVVSFVSTFVAMDDAVETIWCALMVVAQVTCLTKTRLLLCHKKNIEDLRKFLQIANYCSGDRMFDEAARRGFRRKTRALVVTLGLLMVCQQVICWIPQPQQSRTFYVPPWVGFYFGKGLAYFIQVIYISNFVLFWVSKLFGCTIVSSILMIGMHSEQEILVHHFERIAKDMEDLRDNYFDNEQTKKQYWNKLKTLIKSIAEQQGVILSKLSKLQSMVESLFFYVYYFDLVAIGSTFFIVFSEQFSFMHIVIATTVVVISLECYVLCSLIESLKDTFDTISGHVCDICSQLPYSADYRREYFEMRTTLVTIALCSQNIVQFGCLGISNLSVQVFTELVNTSYTVLTFLLNMV